MLSAIWELRYLCVTFGGVVAASLTVMVGGARLTLPPPEPRFVPIDRTETPYFQQLVRDSHELRQQNLALKCRVADLEAARGTVDVLPSDKIPATSLPTTPKE